MIKRLCIPSANFDLIYHFTKLDNALKYVISSNRLKFNKLSEMDDPYETEYLIGAIDVDRNFRQHSENQVKLNKLRGNTLIKCFCQDMPFNSAKEREYPFNKGWAKPRMWSQYGDYHRGACLVFDRHELLEAIKQGKYVNSDPLVGPVKYDDREFYKLNDILGEKLKKATDISQFLSENQKILFFLKCSDYQDEDEFRIVLPGYNNDLGEDCLIDYQKSLKACILGYRYDEYYDPIIENFQNTKNIPFYRLGWIYGKPELYSFNKKDHGRE